MGSRLLSPTIALGFLLLLLPGGISGMDAPVIAQTTADQWMQQGVTQFQTNRFSEAIESWQQALTRYRQEQKLPEQALTLERLGLAYRVLGNYSEAIAHFQQQRSLSQQLKDLSSTARAWAYLGSIYRYQGRYAQSLESYEASRKLLQDSQDERSKAQVLAFIGNLQIELGNYQEAARLHQQGLEIAQKQNDPAGRQSVVLSLNGLGAIAAAQANYDQAKTYYQRSLKAAQEIKLRSAEGDALNNLGSIEHAQKHYAEAVNDYQQALQIARELKNPRMEVAALGGLGLAYTNLRDYAQAESLQQQGRTIARQLQDRQMESLMLSNLAYTLRKQKKLAEAEPYLRQALQLLEEVRASLDEDNQRDRASERDRDQRKVSLFDTQTRVYANLQRLLIDQQKPEAALEVAERSRARPLVDLLTRRQSSGSVTTPQSALSLAEIRRVARETQSTLVMYSVIPEEDFIAQGKLRGKETDLYIWVMKPDGTIHFRQQPLAGPKPYPPIQELVARSRSALGTRGAFNFNAAAAEPIVMLPEQVQRNRAQLQQLHQLLIAPIAEFLPTDPQSRVVFLPQGSLFLVSFAALQDPQGQYLLQKHTIAIAPAIQVLELTHQQGQRIRQMPWTGAPEELLVVGNPVMPTLKDVQGNVLRLAALPGAEQEAKKIAGILKTQAMLGQQASEVEVRSRFTQARQIHLATHGLLDDFGTGVPGAIALSSTPDKSPLPESENGFLTSLEIADLELKADLVVLSACDTGGGTLTGDGVIGLSRSLISAGASNVVVSLWKVPDTPTAFLMEQFYTNLQEHRLNKAQALRQAMLATEKAYPDPVNWAAFILVGEAD